eukprot:CAMPEP_0185612778 /NCGR_PEP_ID=MMETSP0436-20130131/23477_1 /TAXON_ID=626734 ORGANISM="Favella taraikaensis, Strain Fe Narragansett Bay" /NCGR_SAMPLE_ID=MMETSP0436 /ASSEMBLY_ACC=CAM_ASM_000390 /LENGTH=124 /DNA_ID=CAMNT_0028246419 /DNA_START=671 /DNA_END=1042 /DNA_ORIENTATION=-
MLQRAAESYFEAFKLVITYLSPVNATRLSVALNYTIFLVEFSKDHQKAIMLSRISVELAQTIIDDSAEPDKCFTREEYELLEHINFNIELWVGEEEAAARAALAAEREASGQNDASHPHSQVPS